MKSERQQFILELLEQRHAATVKEIADALGVSDMTVRRDLTELASDGSLVRVHGGAQLPSSAHGSSLARVHSHEEKRAAARLAASHVEAGDTIFLGGGTTLELMCDYLSPSNIRVITNSVPVLNLLANSPHVELFLLGGTMRQDTRVFTTPFHNRLLARFTPAKAFISATGIFGNEVFGSYPDVGLVLADACARAHKRYLVVDDEKVGERDFCAFSTLDKMDAVFMNPNADPQSIDALCAYTSVITH